LSTPEYINKAKLAKAIFYDTVNSLTMNMIYV